MTHLGRCVWASLVFSTAATGCQGTISGPATEPQVAPDAGVEEEETELLSCVPASGSRLKRVLQRYEDGSEVFVGHHDSELGVRCAFETASDGSLRCVPRDAELAPSGSLFHTDPNCTQRLAQVSLSPATPGAPRFATLTAPTSTTCERIEWVARLGALRAFAPDDTVYAIRDGVCVPRPAGTSRYHDITALLDPTEMVAGSQTWVGGERMEMVQIDGDDGSRACDSSSLRDRDLDMATCNTRYTSGDEVRCLPAESVAAESAFSDAACSAGMTVGVSYDTCGSPRRYAIESPADECPAPSTTRVFKLAEEMSGALYREIGEQCTTMGSTSTVYAVEEEVPTTMFAEIVRAWQPLGERLERGDLASSDGLRFHRTLIRDAELGASCSLEIAGDGQTRCVPRPSTVEPLLSVVTRYTDRDCQVPLVVATPAYGVCAPETPALASGKVDGKVQVFHTGAAIGTPLYDRLTDTFCAATPEGEAYFGLGEVVAPETFLAGQEVVE